MEGVTIIFVELADYGIVHELILGVQVRCSFGLPEVRERDVPASDQVTCGEGVNESLATGVSRTQCWVSRHGTRYTNVWSPPPLATGAFRARCCGAGACYVSRTEWTTDAAAAAHRAPTTGRWRARGDVGIMRVGEASNPGPGAEAGMSITTANGTGWGTILDWVGHHRGHVICGQEHRVVEEDIEYERGRAAARGWKTMWAPAVASGTEANQASAGVVVMVRSHVGMAEPPGGAVVVPGRVCAAMVEVSGIGWMVIYSVYGHCGDELGAHN